jgi:uncharacterized protein (DUF433 family)
MERITFNPEQCGGRPCIRGMRIRVKDVLDLLAAGVSEADILADYPYLEADDIRACLAYAAEAAGKLATRPVMSQTSDCAMRRTQQCGITLSTKAQ